MTELGWSLIILAVTAVGAFFVFSWGPVMRVVKSQKPPPAPAPIKKHLVWKDLFLGLFGFAWVLIAILVALAIVIWAWRVVSGFFGF